MAAVGWYRQCDLIHNTRDMDIEIYAKHYKPTMKKSLGSHDLYLIRELGKLQDSFEMTFKKYSIRLDVFCLYEGKDDNWTGAVGGNGTKYRSHLVNFLVEA
ncbi:hypothetical protein LOTGIDRAFT_153015 [Lottia gigantea]|uniref:Uncharacterized protein n=1 Tax=Lottia gigantea TaxID=225164 RepID=V4ALC6_LOTGI|nr:hypothetical protein LOTGIDRAFT_153015 [Lottia gigantea]ESO97907.1 hypothetical protein LOTGIDRAFT_153015 [Lottia gigantea]